MCITSGAAAFEERLLEESDQRAAQTPAVVGEPPGRHALDEMRRLLGILRSDDHGLALGPQPRLAQLDTLVAQMRDGGLPVEPVVEGAEGAPF